jgi:uncharacterized protein (TIGR02569 family)
MMTEGGPPPPSVLAAFAIPDDAVPHRLDGGRGSSWRAGDLVLKPVDDPIEGAWSAKVVARLHEPGLRTAEPVRAASGDWLADGWTATRWIEGAHAPRWADVIAAGARFHAAVADVPRPAFLDRRRDPWAIGDAVAWDDDTVPLDRFARRAGLLADLAAARAPLDLPAQLIHGDLTENVLFADPLPPAVIDLAPYWRPAGFAAAIVVGDVLLWHGSEPDATGLGAGV